MKKLMVFLLVAALLAGCGSAGGGSRSDTAVTFTDDLGRTVTVDAPQRVAALLGSFAQVWQLAGGQVIATADDAWEDLALQLPADTVNLGSTENLSLERLLEAGPDLVLASSKRRQNLQWRETLEAAGICVAYFDISSFDDYLRMLDICTDITGRKDLYQTYGEAVQSRINAVVDRRAGADSPRVLCMVASSAYLKAKNSDANVLGAMLRDLGCTNIADTDSTLLDQLSIEHILLQDPEYIFIVQRGDDEAGMRAYVEQYMAENPAWGQLTAVREGRVYYMDKTLYNLKPNHRWGEAYEKLEAILSHD